MPLNEALPMKIFCIRDWLSCSKTSGTVRHSSKDWNFLSDCDRMRSDGVSVRLVRSSIAAQSHAEPFERQHENFEARFGFYRRSVKGGARKCGALFS